MKFRLALPGALSLSALLAAGGFFAYARSASLLSGFGAWERAIALGAAMLVIYAVLTLFAARPAWSGLTRRVPEERVRLLAQWLKAGILCGFAAALWGSL